MTKIQTRHKFIRTGYKSNRGNHTWKLGVWYTYDGDIDLCNSGFHCSKGVYQAFSYVQGEYLCDVEVKGKHDDAEDKEVWESMRVTRIYKWTKKDSVLLSIFAARLCLENFEKWYSKDKRPREAIEAAEKWVKNPTEKNRRAASAAASAAPSAAESAAWSAAESAARSAARSAAWNATENAARSAAESAAWSAAESAARSAAYEKCDRWMLEHKKNLKVVKEIPKEELHI